MVNIGNRARKMHKLQLAILRLSIFIHRRRSPTISWVVGPVETASMVGHIADAIPSSYSVCLIANRYSPSYPYDFVAHGFALSRLGRIWAGPWLLGRLAREAGGFLYVGGEGFLTIEVDGRDAEFAALTSLGKRIACVFTGDDIRSPRLMRELEKKTGVPNQSTYLAQVVPRASTGAYEEERRRLAASADRHASLVINASVDQMSYLESATEPFLYFFPDDDLFTDSGKHRSAGPRIIVHAPSSPIMKGTQVVRAAVARLRDEGYEFEYRELIGRSHAEVQQAIRQAHIILNQFYGFLPGVFGVEALASDCAVLMSADERIEPGLPAGSNDAWIVTQASDLYWNLRALLDSPERIEETAAAGLDWVKRHATRSVSGARLRTLLARVGDAE